jgi:hypothetical protein
MEPERHIEKLLRAYAKKRRDDPGPAPELHPATRRMLQSEVARRLAKPEKERSSLYFLALLQPRMALALCLAAVVLVGIVLWPGLNPSRMETELAYRDAGELSASAPDEAPPAVAVLESAAPARKLKGTTGAAESAVAREERPAAETLSRAVAARDNLALDRQPASAPTAVAQPVDVGGVRPTTVAKTAATQSRSVESDQGRLFMSAANGSAQTVSGLNLATGYAGDASPRKAEVKAYTRPTTSDVASEGRQEPASGQSAVPGTIAAVTPESGKPRLLDKVGTRTDAMKSPVYNSQRYVQIAPSAAPPVSAGSTARFAAGAGPILTAFQVEQSGGQIRVVDQDGSVYSGYLQLTNALPAAPTAADQNPALAASNADQKAAPPAAQNFYFIVSGTNRSLNQNVLFTGNVLATADESWLKSQSNMPADLRGRIQAIPVNQLQLPLSNSRVTGTAWIESRKQIQINAVPAAP